jgi:hypothetical protein
VTEEVKVCNVLADCGRPRASRLLGNPQPSCKLTTVLGWRGPMTRLHVEKLQRNGDEGEALLAWVLRERFPNLAVPSKT